MQDRFKFRALITCNICIGVEEEKEISFYIYDVAVYSNGDIGFSRDALLDALSKLDLTERQKDEIEEEISENSYCDDYEWYSIEFGKKEQCTGVKDKNGKLIYEGDIVSVETIEDVFGDGIYDDCFYSTKCIWLKEDGAFSLVCENAEKEFPLYGNNIEVIGNVLTPRF